MLINDIQDSIIKEISNLVDEFEKYEFLINMGKKHPLPEFP